MVMRAEYLATLIQIAERAESCCVNAKFHRNSAGERITVRVKFGIAGIA